MTHTPYPDPIELLLWSGAVMLVMTALAFLLNALLPLRWSVAGAAGLSARQVRYLDKSHALHQRLERIVAKLRPGKSVRLVVLPTDQPVALAMAAPFRGVVVLSAGLVKHLPAPALDWVMAHEVAHIRHRDMLTGTIWIASIRGLNAVYRLKYLFVRLLHALLSRLGLGAVSWLFNLVLVLILKVISVARRVAIGWFLLIDRYASRMMEYRADRLAAQHLGAHSGIVALSILQGDSEPLFNGLFATHPKTSNRIEALKRC